MAYAAYRYASKPVGFSATAFVVVDVVADVSEAAHVRHAASSCEGAGVVRCIPLQHDGRVRLQAACLPHGAPMLVVEGSSTFDRFQQVFWIHHIALQNCMDGICPHAPCARSRASS